MGRVKWWVLKVWWGLKGVGGVKGWGLKGVGGVKGCGLLTIHEGVGLKAKVQ